MRRINRESLLFPLCVLGILLAVLAAFVLFGVFSFRALFDVTERVYSPPNERQTTYFLEAAGIADRRIVIAEAETLTVYAAPHQSDSRYALVFSGSVGSADTAPSTAVPTEVRLTADLTLEGVPAGSPAPTVRVYRLTGQDRWLIAADCLPGSVAGELAARAAEN